MKSYSFEITVGEGSLTAFADLSGDYNPLHTDEGYAANTPYRRRVLHGAFAAALVSRMAGMHLPGRTCLLHSMQLKFVSPVIPPVTLAVEGTMTRESPDGGDVEVLIVDATTGHRFTEARYSFGHHAVPDEPGSVASAGAARAAATGSDESVVLISGASGGLGSALTGRFGDAAFPVNRDDRIETPEGRARLVQRLTGRRVVAAVHCGWPAPDNQKLVRLSDPLAALDAHLTQPLAQAVALASVLAEQGAAEATLVLVGSTASNPGSHAWRAPAYSLGKAALPTLARILGMELAAKEIKCINVTFDALDGGMSGQLSAAAKIAQADRSPLGRMMPMAEAARSISWLLDNPTLFISGATIDLSGGALP